MTTKVYCDECDKVLHVNCSGGVGTEVDVQMPNADYVLRIGDYDTYFYLCPTFNTNDFHVCLDCYYKKYVCKEGWVDVSAQLFEFMQEIGMEEQYADTRKHLTDMIQSGIDKK
jgi:hypothetical protein|tara:strand:- start:271 stop:609 length:339 start_codon:yes stop_codon:yes gene_type:complete